MIETVENQSDVLLEVGKRQKNQVPAMYRIILLNDDFTPMDFVVTVLKKYFGKSQQAAVDIMLTIHKTGSGVCGVFTKDIASTLVAKVIQFIKQAEYPLRCLMEKI